MASQKDFAVNPTVSITRSKFKRPSQHKTTIKLGEITPIYLNQDVLPGSTYSINLSDVIRMSTPILPIMDNIHIDFYAFFVPNRLVWSHWKEFMGENNTSAGIYTGSTYYVPTYDIKAYAGVKIGGLGDHLGLPIVTGFSSGSLPVSALPGRAYCLIYNEWFRDQNIISPIAIETGDLNLVTVGDAINYNSDLLKAAKDSDYFTRALPYAQKGGAVRLPLGTTAPVYFQNGSTAVGSSTNVQIGPLGSNAKTDAVHVNGNDVTTYADLAGATAATINQLRFAFQYQKLLEKDSVFGSRYWETLKGHFSINAPDASLQRPQLLGSFRQHINIDQVLQTTGYNAAPSSNDLARTGANSVSGASGKNLVTFSAVEHGIIMILAVARHDQTYGQGVERGWSRKSRTDYYFPVFANLGAQEIKNKELYAQGTSADDSVFGYQEAWSEYRYKPSVCTGYLRPSAGNSLAPWTLANNFASLPTLGKTFIEQGRDNIANCLVTSSTGPDFIADFYFDETAVLPMPLYSIPGFIDHH